MPKIEVIGVYPIEAREPVHLVEVWIHGVTDIVEIGGITQETLGQPKENWQVPYLEHVLNVSGDEIIADYDEMTKRSELWRGDMRLVFFFHFLDFARTLRTPFGEVELPTESELPERLSIIEYEQP